MPPLPTPITAFNLYDKNSLYKMGINRVRTFCLINRLPIPEIGSVINEVDWPFSACAYYRPTYIRICLPACAHPATEGQVRNWNWPGSTTDREPYGVLCHELGHHADYEKSNKRGEYFGDYGEGICRQSGEQPISGYHPNEAEWFAEMFRIFVTNHALLAHLRPRTHALLMQDWKPVSNPDWKAELGPDCPNRIVRSLVNKGAVLLDTGKGAAV